MILLNIVPMTWECSGETRNYNFLLMSFHCPSCSVRRGYSMGTYFRELHSSEVCGYDHVDPAIPFNPLWVPSSQFEEWEKEVHTIVMHIAKTTGIFVFTGRKLYAVESLDKRDNFVPELILNL